MSSLKEQLEKLKSFKCIIIVEGAKDKAALKELGIRNVLQMKGPLYKIVDQVKEKECIILTDLDKEGKKLYATFKKALERNHVKVNDAFRNFLFKNTSLRQIEGLTTYIENHEEET